MLINSSPHEITAELPWEERPPGIGGFNHVVARPGSQTVLLVQRFDVNHMSGRFEFRPYAKDPLLVLGAHGEGRTAALMTDLAPHWVGGFVDWQDDARVKAKAPGSWEIEVGNLYAQFIANLLTWTGQLAGVRV